MRRLIVPACLALLALLVFAGALRNGFTNWDDDLLVTGNALLGPLDGPGIVRIFRFQSVVGGDWVPVTILSLAVDRAAWGMRPSAFHLTNLLFHALCTVLLYALLLSLFSARAPDGESRAAAALAAGLFAIHPVQVESVAWIAERKNVLGMAFLLGAFLAYLRATSGAARPGAAATFLLLFAASLLSKAQAVILPPLLLCYEAVERPRGAPVCSRALRAGLLAAALALALAAGVGKVRALGVQGAPRMTGTIEATIATAPVLVLGYVKDLLLPMNRSPILSRSVHEHVWDPASLGALAILLAITLAALALRRSRPHLAFFWLWFLGGLALVLHVVPISTLAADRFQYWAAPGLFALAGLAAVSLAGRLPAQRRPLAAGLGIAAAAFLAALTVNYVPAWRGPLALWGRAAATTPGNPLVWTKLGETYVEMGRLDDGEAALRRALGIEPDFAPARQTLGLALVKKGFVTDGMRLLEGGAGPGIRTAEYEASIWNNVGAEHFGRGRTREALDAFTRALTLTPDDPKVRANLGAAWMRLGNLPAAERNLRTALVREPANVTTLSNLGAVLLARGDTAGAERNLREALRIDPRHTDATYNMACLEARRGRSDEAFRWLDRLAALGYRNPEALRADADLAPLRADPRFDRLLARMRRVPG